MRRFIAQIIRFFFITACMGHFSLSAEITVSQNEWELRSSQGEMVLPDLFYSEDFQNEQLAPIPLEEGQYKIDRLIYPTLGNPNLYHRPDESDEFFLVLRLPLEETMAFNETVIESTTNANQFDSIVGEDVQWDDANLNGVRVFIAKASNRPLITGTEMISPEETILNNKIFTVRPSRIFKHDQRFLPSPFNLRQTYRLLFTKNDLPSIPAGLYDIRIEIIRKGELLAREFQYNALKIFDSLPNPELLKVINIADSQVSTHFASLTKATGQSKSAKELREFVNYVRFQKNQDLADIPFILSNGDLMNGGGLGLLDINQIFFNYQDETNVVLQNLKDLPYPIFLTPGNHDGHVSFGWHQNEEGRGKILSALQEVNPQQSPAFQQFLKSLFLKNFPGKEVDIFNGTYERKLGSPMVKDSYVYRPEEDRNFVLYDGSNHWRKLFGPLFYSFRWGQQYFISLNSFDLRQHHRAGIGQYVANHGGNISPIQMEWLEREIQWAQSHGLSVTLLTHHDPRGGHLNEWFGHYYYQRNFKGIWDNIWSYVKFKLPFRSKHCREVKGKCFEGGLQDWMLPDPQFDCPALSYSKEQKSCALQPPFSSSDLYFSGPNIIKTLAKSTVVKNVVLGHIHGLRCDLIKNGQRILPTQSPNKKHPIDIYNDEHASLIDSLNQTLEGPDYNLQGSDLIFAKMSSLSSLAQDKINFWRPIFGFSLLSFTPRRAQNLNESVLSKIEFFQNMNANAFKKYITFDLDREKQSITKTEFVLKDRKAKKDQQDKELGVWANTSEGIVTQNKIEGGGQISHQASEILRPSLVIEEE